MEKVIEGKLKIGKNLVHVFRERVTKDEAIKFLAARLQESGYVKTSFESAVLEREAIFPTGLPTEPVGVAIPHTDTEHVHVSALAVGILASPVAFQEMGSVDSEINVNIISMMAISDPKSVMSVLRNLALAYQDQQFLSLLRDSPNEDMALDLLKARLPDVIELV